AERRGELPAHLDPDAVARVMIALFQGFVLQQAWDPGARVAPYLAVIDVLLARLTAETPPSRGRRRRGRAAGGAARDAARASPSRASAGRVAAAGPGHRRA